MILSINRLYILNKYDKFIGVIYISDIKGKWFYQTYYINSSKVPVMTHPKLEKNLKKAINSIINYYVEMTKFQDHIERVL